MNSLIQKLKADCDSVGYGRKKWWADQLGIPPLTLSHWLGGRQRPNGQHVFIIKEFFDQKEDDKKFTVWKEFLWGSYYTGKSVPQEILPIILLEILSSSRLDSRTLALLSRYIERESPKFDVPESGKLRNRLGWLLEISGQKALFSPDKSVRNSTLLKISDKSRELKKYLHQYQTPLGKKWHLADCPLDEIKKSLP